MSRPITYSVVGVDAERQRGDTYRARALALAKRVMDMAVRFRRLNNYWRQEKERAELLLQSRNEAWDKIEYLSKQNAEVNAGNLATGDALIAIVGMMPFDELKAEREAHAIWLSRAAQSELLAAALPGEYARGLEAAAAILRKWAGHYPTDIFPEDGQSIDCQSAAFARHLCREIEKDIRAAADSGPGVGGVRGA